MLGDTVNERALRILLECNLVLFWSVTFTPDRTAGAETWKLITSAPVETDGSSVAIADLWGALLPLRKLMSRAKQKQQQQSIPVGCVPPACKPYVLQWPPSDIPPRGIPGPAITLADGKERFRVRQDFEFKIDCFFLYSMMKFNMASTELWLQSSSDY